MSALVPRPIDRSSDEHDGTAPTSRGWKNRVEIRSETSDRIYVVAQRVSDDTWGCSCPAWKRRRTCKHLAAMALPSAPAKAIGTTRPAGRASDGFAESAFAHYDTAGGFGSSEEWVRIAERLAAGRHYRVAGTAAGPHAADLALLGLAAVPATVRPLVVAMRQRATVLHPDHGGDPAAFKAMFAAYERLLRLFPQR